MQPSKLFDAAGVPVGVREAPKLNRKVGEAVGVRLGVCVGRGVHVEVGEGVVYDAVLVEAAPAVDATIVSNMPGPAVGLPETADRIGKPQPLSETTSTPNAATIAPVRFASPTSHHMLSPPARQSSSERES